MLDYIHLKQTYISNKDIYNIQFLQNDTKT